MIEYSKEQIIELFRSNEKDKYNKFGSFLCRPGVLGETILTIVSGKLETMKTVLEKSIVIMNINIGGGAEQYVISANKFYDRYKHTGEGYYKINGHNWETCKPTGSCYAFEYHGEDISFTAPWGEAMLLTDGDYLASTGLDSEDVYRIEKETFAQTYKKD